MEKKFLQYLLYSALIDIRHSSHENNDKRTFWITHLLHNVPLHIDTEEEVKETMQRVFEDAEPFGLSEWLNNRMEDFNKLSLEKGKDVVVKPTNI